MKQKKHSDLTQAAIAGGAFETISRYGSAGAEFLKGLRGIDYETGQVFDRSLLKISKYKLDPNHVESNIKQQAGYAAEVAGVSRKNAQAIMEGKPNRFVRSEDLAHYGKNHQSVDIVELIDGKEISTSQMKFVSKTDELLQKIARGKGGGKNDLSRYLKVDKLEVPTEQVEQMKATCQRMAKKLSNQAKAARAKGNVEFADRLEQESKNYQKLEKKITDSGLSTQEAIEHRLSPTWSTVKDVAKVSHKAGIEGAKLGAAIGGSISLVSNIIAVSSGNKEFEQALLDTSKDTLIAAGVGYGTGFAGSVIKTLMQQSSKEVVRGLSKTGLPGAIVSMCLSTGKAINAYAQGEIDEAELLKEMGSITTGLVSASLFTVLGQMAIPIPVVGALIGSMIGHVLANNFYHGFFGALNDAKLAAERRKEIEMKCQAAMAIAQRYEQSLKALFDKKVAQLNKESRAMFAVLENPTISADEFCIGMNQFAEMLDKKISIHSMEELDEVMLSNKPLII